MAQLPGSNAALLEVVDRILRLTLNEQVACSLTSTDLDGLQHRANEALETLALADASPGGHGADCQVAAATPSLCGLAVECVRTVERAQLTVGLARLVAAGCEILSALLVPRLGQNASAIAPSGEFAWVDDTLEDLSDQLDFLALEVYCGLGRLEGAAYESQELPIVPDHIFDRFESYWGSLEHRQALQELSTWLLCVVFRAIGYSDVTARGLMEFTNHDLLCLCALLRGLLACRPGDHGLPHDSFEIQGVALNALCGLTAPELAFPYYGEDETANINDQNRVLALYREVLCAAVVETGLMEAAVTSTLVYVRGMSGAASNLGVRFLSFLAALIREADRAEASTDDIALPPALRVRAEIARHADQLGSLLDLLVEQPPAGAILRELMLSCAGLAAPLSRRENTDGADDGFTFACRVLLANCLDAGCTEDSEGASMLAALASLAASVGDLEISKPRFAELVGRICPEDRARARSRLTRPGSLRLEAHDVAAIAEIFGDAALPEAVAPEPALSPAPVGSETTCAPLASVIAVPTLAPASAPAPAKPAAAATPGLRDIITNAPEQFRCALDRKLLCDPVVSPGGVVFERSTLVKWLQNHGSFCPITGAPLRIEDCARSPEIRKQVALWARSAGRESAARKKAKKGALGVG